jgi:cysteine-rich repeat protein
MQRLAIVVAVLACSLGAAARPAFAQFDCANGVLNFGEECDDGNTVAGDCCSPGCRFESSATACRPSAEACDAAEYCTGESATCPDDTGILGDTDADGYCDPLDPCPSSADPDPLLDTDADGVGDACDLCTSSFTKVRGFRLRVRKLDLPIGQQRLLFHGYLAVPDLPAIDPIAKPIRLVMTDARGVTVFDTTIPPIEYDGGTRIGWMTNGNEKWVFSDGLGQIPGVDTAVLRVTPAREPHAVDVRFKVEARSDMEVIKPKFPATLTLIIDTPLAKTSQCAEVALDTKRCNLRNSGNKLYCR